MLMYILLCLNHNFRSFVDLIFNPFRTVKEEVSYIQTTDRFHMTSRRPYWGTKKIKKVACGIEVFSLVKQFSFVPRNLHSCWPREWKRSKCKADMNNWGANMFSNYVTSTSSPHPFTPLLLRCTKHHLQSRTKHTLVRWNNLLSVSIRDEHIASNT